MPVRIECAMSEVKPTPKDASESDIERANAILRRLAELEKQEDDCEDDLYLASEFARVRAEGRMAGREEAAKWLSTVQPMNDDADLRSDVALARAGYHPGLGCVEALRISVAAAIRKAVAEEREACERACLCEWCAKEIHARGAS